MSKLPSEISLRLLVARKATDNVWKIDDLLKTIKSEVEAREMSEMARSNASEKPPNKKQGSLPTVGSFVVTKNGKNGEGSFKVRCAFCHELHYSASCEKVTDRDSRLKLLRDSNRCFVCLKIGHRANMCDITKKCRHCSGRHHQSICNNPSNYNRQQCDDKKVPENQNSNKGPEGSDPPTTAAVTQTTKGSVLLQTARATVSNESRLVPARILFDTGSQRSYIRKSLQNRLRLNPIGKETLQRNTFGESKSKRETVKCSRQTLRTRTMAKV